MTIEDLLLTADTADGQAMTFYFQPLCPFKGHEGFIINYVLAGSDLPA